MANNPGVTLLLEVFKNIDFQALSDKNENPVSENYLKNF